MARYLTFSKRLLNPYWVFCRIYDQSRSKLRILHFRLLGIRIGHGCYVGKGVTMRGDIHIGSNTAIGDNTYIGTYGSGRIEIGAGSHLGNMNQIGSSVAKVIIGEKCLFAPWVMITDSAHNIFDRHAVIMDSGLFGAPTVVESGVWLGKGVLVMHGVTVGKGAVVGANALVKQDIPPYSVSVGVPAVPIYFRS